MPAPPEDDELRSVALENAKSILRARQQAERELLAAKEALERKTEELQQQRQWFEVTLSSIGDAVITTDVTGKVTYLNPVAESMTGWSSAEAAGRPLEQVFAIVNEYTREPVENPVGRVLQTGKTVGLANHTALIDKSGRHIPIEDSAAPIRDPGGTLIGVVMVFHDVTERRAAEEALRANEERLRAGFDQAAVGIVSTDLDGRFREVNKKFCSMIEYSPTELRDLTLLQIVHPKDLSAVQTQIAALLAGEIAHCTFEMRALRKNGGLAWNHATFTLARGLAGEARQLIGIIEDINERKHAENALREAHTKSQELQAALAAIVESSDDAIISKTLEGVISTWNVGAERMFGYTAAEAIGAPITMLFPPELIDQESAILERLRRGERIEHFETVRKRKDGTLLDVSLSISPLKDASGEITGASKIARNVTERKRAEAALREEIAVRESAEAALREADRRKDEFLATLAHELRNPLAPIRQAALIAKARTATEAQKRWASDVIGRQVRHMALLLEDLLDISRITRGTLELRTETVVLAEVVEAAIETVRPLIDAKRHVLSLDLPADPVHFVADPLRLAQVLSNLLTNAAKYTDPGGRLRLCAACDAENLVIRVIDNGIGLAPDSLGKLFEMFSQLPSNQERSEGGLGIGLALTRGLVKLHDGEIEARSAGIGQGSEFTVRLPLRTKNGFGQKLPLDVPPGRPRTRRVLIADDNRDTAETMAALLRMDGHEVAVASNGRDALAAFSAMQPEVVLLDIGMPELNGYEVARRVRQGSLGRAVTLIAVTGWGQDNDKAQSLAAGFNHHFTKPVETERLRELLHYDILSG